MAGKEMSEMQMTNAICKYLQLAYPKVKWRTDRDGQYASKSALWAKASQKGVRGFPDLLIRERRKGFNALVLELKKDGTKIFKQDGSLYKDEHLHEQQEWLEWFNSIGCKAQFSIGYDSTIKIIDWYLK